MSQEIAIEVKDLHISYKCLKSFSIKRSLLQMKKTQATVFEAVRGVSFTVPKGEILGITGKNGSGKSTALSLIAAVLKPASGTVSVKGRIGYVPQGTALFEDMSTADNLRFFAGLAGVTVPEALPFGIERYLKKKVSALSGGTKKRVSIACALLGDQRILIMDEPTSALDVGQKEIIHRYIKDFTAQKGVVIMATHDIIEMELCDRLYHLSEHRLTEADVNQVVYLLRKEND